MYENKRLKMNGFNLPQQIQSSYLPTLNKNFQSVNNMVRDSMPTVFGYEKLSSLQNTPNEHKTRKLGNIYTDSGDTDRRPYVRSTELEPSKNVNNMFQYFVSKTKNVKKNVNNNEGDGCLFDTRVLKKINTNDLLFKYESLNLIKINDNSEYAFDLGDNLVLRSLKIGDYDREYMKLMEQLTVVGDVAKDKFESRFHQMKLCPNTYFILVVEDLNFNKIIGTATLVNEQKFIRHASSKGRIEDVVVDDRYRGKKLGRLLLDILVSLGKLLGCYKISLDCKDSLKKFYQQFGFNLEEGQNYLVKRF